MAFIELADFDIYIREGNLDELIDSETTQFDQAVAVAEEEVYSYLAKRYDADQIFAAVGAARNTMVLKCMVDITLFHLHSRVTPNQVPAVRNDRYVDSIAWMKAVYSGEINPRLPEKIDDKTNDQNALFRFGSNPRFKSEY
jgi:phage gp36-like protein